jgi:hypothetical protein
LSVKALRAEIEQCQIVCTNCHRRRTARRRRWWRLAPSKIIEHPALTPSQKRNLLFIRNLLWASRCVDCGERDLVVLEFDHLGRKRDNVVRAAYSGHSLDWLLEEVARCVIRCANCHRRRHAALARSKVSASA